MSSIPHVKRDVVLSPFGGDSQGILSAAVAAEAAGADGVWIFDHISSLASISAPGAGASRDPFVLLGAIAAHTERVRIGVLVANIHNRHPAQLALAMDTLAGLAPGRVVCGVGAGAGPGSPFAREDEALRRIPAPASQRRKALGDYLRSLRAIWAGGDAVGRYATSGLRGVTVNPRPPIIVGGGAMATLGLAAELADGVNIVTGITPGLRGTVEELRGLRRQLNGGEAFEIGVFTTGRTIEDAHPQEELHGIDRVTLLTEPGEGLTQY